jgi:hypothetical protein
MNKNADSDLTIFERELQEMKPAPVPDRLRRKISAELKQAERLAGASAPKTSDWGWFTMVSSVAAAAAASVAIYFMCHSEPAKLDTATAVVRQAQPAKDANTKAADEFRPVLVKTEMVGQRQEEPVYVANVGPVRKIRYSFVDDVRWRNDRRSMTLSARMPREEVVLVSLDTY